MRTFLHVYVVDGDLPVVLVWVLLTNSYYLVTLIVQLES